MMKLEAKAGNHVWKSVGKKIRGHLVWKLYLNIFESRGTECFHWLGEPPGRGSRGNRWVQFRLPGY